MHPAQRKTAGCPHSTAAHMPNEGVPSEICSAAEEDAVEAAAVIDTATEPPAAAAATHELLCLDQ